MNIGVIGAGNIGATAARLFANAGYRVAIGNTRGPDSLRELGPNVEAATVEEVADFDEVVLMGIPFGRYETLPSDWLAGKVVVDAMNYYAGRDGRMDFGDLTSSEVVARQMPRARLVKAFNMMYYETLRTKGRPSDGEVRLVLLVAGNDAEAKALVSQLIEEIGFEPVATGSLKDGGRKQQPGSPIYNNPMTAKRAHTMLPASADR